MMKDKMRAILHDIATDAVRDVDLVARLRRERGHYKRARSHQRFIFGLSTLGFGLLSTLIVLLLWQTTQATSPSGEGVPYTASRLYTESLVSYRGIINVRIRNSFQASAAPEATEWEYYVWYSTPQYQRVEIFTRCPGQVTASWSEDLARTAQEQGVLSQPNGPSGERCDLPNGIILRDGTGLLRVWNEGVASLEYVDTVDINPLAYTGLTLRGLRPTNTDRTDPYTLRQTLDHVYERVQVVGTDIIAGRAATVVDAHFTTPASSPNEEGVTRQRFWIDEESGILLGGESFDEEGISYSQWVFTRFDLNPVLDPNTFAYLPSPQRQVYVLGMDRLWRWAAVFSEVPVLIPPNSLFNTLDVFSELVPQHPTYDAEANVVAQNFNTRAAPHAGEVGLRLIQGSPSSVEAFLGGQTGAPGQLTEPYIRERDEQCLYMFDVMHTVEGGSQTTRVALQSSGRVTLDALTSLGNALQAIDVSASGLAHVTHQG
jgi:hypothetical protein